MRRLLALLTCLLVLTVATGSRPLTLDTEPVARIACSTLCHKINRIRVNHGLPRLHEYANPTTVASRWTRHMAGAGALSHNPNLTEQMCCWQAIGENVGVGPSTRAIVRAFMHSPGHRANILDPDFDNIGVGVVHRDGSVWITLDFRQHV